MRGTSMTHVGGGENPHLTEPLICEHKGPDRRKEGIDWPEPTPESDAFWAEVSAGMHEPSADNFTRPGRRHSFDHAEAMRRYRAGDTATAIAEDLGCSAAAIYSVASKHGIKRTRSRTPEGAKQGAASQARSSAASPSRSGPVNGSHRVPPTTEERSPARQQETRPDGAGDRPDSASNRDDTAELDDLVRQVRHLYLEEKLSREGVAATLGISTSSVHRIIKRHDIHRPPAPALRETPGPAKDAAHRHRSKSKLAQHTATIIDRYGAGESSTVIAADFGCTPAAITALLHRNHVHVRTRAEGQRIRYGNQSAGGPAVKGKKTCVRCARSKPVVEFPEHKESRDGRAGACRDCLNNRPPTETRAIRNRARNRAYTALVERHEDEWQQLLEAKTVEVTAEFDRIRAAAGKDGDPVPRLKPGPRRKDQSDVIERIDVARCCTCQTHHDAKHVCPTCGDDTPENQPLVPPYLIRAWAREQGMAPVPPTGPLPKRITNAYLAAHGQEANVS